MGQHSQLTPYLEACCLRMSANVSYQQAAEDIEYFTGMQVSRSVQQQLVHRQEFALPPAILIMENQLELGGTANSSPSIMKVSK